MSLKEYKQKRKFSQTPEPKGKLDSQTGSLQFVVQKHDASRLHYDFRIELIGVLKSWAVPKGPPSLPEEQRLAVLVEDHPLEYGSFEGTIPKGNYGAGTVVIWDKGTYHTPEGTDRLVCERSVLEGFKNGIIHLILHGSQLHGEFVLIATDKNTNSRNWLMRKKRDRFSNAAPEKKKNSQFEVKIESQVLKPTSEKLHHSIKPMISTATSTLLEHRNWIYEVSAGGYRALARVDGSSVKLTSKQNLLFNLKFPTIVKALKNLNVHAIFDGEISGEINPIFWIQDLLHLEGKNLREMSLIERKKILRRLPIFCENLKLLPFAKGSFQSLLKTPTPPITLIAKHVHSRYQPGTTSHWLHHLFTEEASPAANQPASAKSPLFTHLRKIYWPKDHITKKDLIEYYRFVAPLILPHLMDRPQSLHRYPNGIHETGFFQKDLRGYHPKEVKTVQIYSESSKRSIEYLLCQNESTLLYMANLGCIEINPWLSKVHTLDFPEIVIIDLDPDEVPFREVVRVALLIHRLLESVAVPHFCKTSGKRGLHIGIPLQARYTYDQAREFVLKICGIVQAETQETTSLERNPGKRRGKIYLDCFQNRRGHTVASVYSTRPINGAYVSTPVQWKEVSNKLDPKQFTLKTVLNRFQKFGDLWSPVLTDSVDIESATLSLDQVSPKKLLR